MFDNVGKTNDVEAAKRRAASLLITMVIGGAVTSTVFLYGLLTVAKAVQQVVQEDEMVEISIEDPAMEDAPPPPPPPPAGPSTPEDEEDEKVPEEMSEVVKELDKEIKEEVKADVASGGDPAGVEGGVEGGVKGGVVGGEMGGTGTTLGGYKTMHHSDVEWKNRVIPDYPEAAREMNLGDQECRVRMFVDEKGMPNNIDFVACPKVFQDAAKEAFFKSRWYPAKVENLKTKSQFVLIYSFKAPR